MLVCNSCKKEIIEYKYYYVIYNDGYDVEICLSAKEHYKYNFLPKNISRMIDYYNNVGVRYKIFCEECLIIKDIIE